MATAKMSGKLRLMMIGVSVSALTHPSAGFAQAAGDAAAEAGVGLEDIVVTAQKRAENIRDVPISITALSSGDLEKSGVNSSLDLTSVVPGLKMDRVGGSTIPAIRGVSSFLTTVGTDSNVAMYVDNVYVASQQAATLDFPDISRVEVLKGPQGTLFGRNATGGAIRIFTKDPELNSFGGDFSASYGNYDNLVFKGFVTVPIIPEKLAISVSGYRETGDTYYRNLTPDVPLEGIHNYNIRGKILFQPSEDTRLLISAYIGQRRDPSAVLFFPLDGITVANDVPGAIIPTRPYDVATDVPIFEKSTNDGVSVELNQGTSIGDFTAIGSWNHVTSHGPVPIIAAAYPEPFTGYQSDVNDRSEAWSAELNFASRKFGGFSFIAGANYFDKDDKWDPLTVDQYIPGSVTAVSIFSGQSTKAYAFYGEATYQLTDRLNIIGGIRYSNEKRRVTGSVVGGLVADGEYYNWGQKTFTSVTHRVSARYDIADRTNVYFTYSTGFKSGNFIPTSIPFGVTPEQCTAANQATPGSCAFPSSLKPEKITAFELGVKSAPLSWLRFDAALFAYELKQIQIQSYTNVCLTGTCPPDPLVQLSSYSNAASARMYGAEVNVDAQVTNELRFNVGVSILDASFSSYENASWLIPSPDGNGLIQAPTQSASGKRMPRAPRATLSLSATYGKELPAGEISFTASGYVSDKLYYDVGNVYAQSSYATLGLRASFSPAAVPGLTGTIWGNNITDKRTIANAIIGSSGANVAFAKPRTYGVTVGYKF